METCKILTHLADHEVLGITSNVRDLKRSTYIYQHLCGPACVFRTPHQCPGAGALLRPNSQIIL